MSWWFDEIIVRVNDQFVIIDRWILQVISRWQMILLNARIVFIHIWNASWYAESMHRWLILNFAHDIKRFLIVEILDLIIMIFDVFLICFYSYSVWDIDCQRFRSRSHFETKMIEREIIDSMCIKCVDVWHECRSESSEFSLNLMYCIRFFEIDARVHIFRFILKLKFDLFDHSFSAKMNDQWSNKYVQLVEYQIDFQCIHLLIEKSRKNEWDENEECVQFIDSIDSHVIDKSKWFLCTRIASMNISSFFNVFNSSKDQARTNRMCDEAVDSIYRLINSHVIDQLKWIHCTRIASMNMKIDSIDIAIDKLRVWFLESLMNMFETQYNYWRMLRE
jgi:hypothetical protein